MQDLANSLEAAIKYRIEEGQFPVNIYTGQGDYQKEHPSIVVHAESGDEMPLGSGNFNIRVNCELRYAASDVGVYRELARDVLGQLMVSDLASKLTEEGDGLTVFGIKDRQIQSGIDENHWLSTLSFTAYCCVLDIA